MRYSIKIHEAATDGCSLVLDFESVVVVLEESEVFGALLFLSSFSALSTSIGSSFSSFPAVFFDASVFSVNFFDAVSDTLSADPLVFTDESLADAKMIFHNYFTT